MATQSRTKLIPITKDGTKKSTRMFNFGAKFLPKRMNILAWLLAITGTLLIIISVISAAG